MRRNLPKLLSKTNLKCKPNRDKRNKYSSKQLSKTFLSSSKNFFDEQKAGGDIKDGVFQIDFTGSYITSVSKKPGQL